jgi:serine/threonine-protein kinase
MVRAELTRVLSSSLFAGSQRLSGFLKFVVERATQGKSDELKEYSIGVAVFGRESDFDPRIDPIVRVQAAQLRSKLMEYYNTDGRGNALVISIPKGGYSPAFTRTASARQGQAANRRASLAVLPFMNMSPEPDNEYFSDGLTEEIINTLAGVPGLQVVARTSVFHFKGQHRDVREIGGQLNVDTILEGSVRKAGAQLRITAQLINVRDGFHLWSHTFKRELRDIFDVQEEIAQSVRKALAPHFGGGQATRPRHYEASPDAHDSYLKGRYAQARLVGGNVEQAIGFFEQAITADDNYAAAYAGLADAWYLLAFHGVVEPHAALPKAKAAAARALELDEGLPEARAALGSVQCAYEWNWEEGRRNIERALELDPDSALINQAYASQVLASEARLEEAIALFRKVTALDPFLPGPQATLTFLWGAAGRVDEAEKQHRITLATNPNYFFSHGMMAWAYEMNGMFPQAIAAIAKAVEGSHGLTGAVAGMGRIHASAGNVDRAQDVLRQLLEARKQRYVAATDIAAIHSALRDRKRTLEWLGEAVEEHTMQLFFIWLDPRWRWLHDDAGFQKLTRRVGLRRPAR